jgi:hypothetical protein
LVWEDCLKNKKKNKTATFVPLAFARLRAKVIFIRIKLVAVQPFSYFYKNQNSSLATFALALQPLLVALQRQERQERQLFAWA